LINEKAASRILIFGGPEEEELKNKIAALSDNHAVKTVSTKNLGQTAAIMKRCDLFVSNDSSLMHVASALQLKTVAVIGPTNPSYIHPWKTDYRIASINIECAPCFIYSPRPLICFRDDVQFKCIKDLDVNLVYNKVLELLG
jgi:ADP-heptose:LPS heptosyltransferase